MGCVLSLDKLCPLLFDVFSIRVRDYSLMEFFCRIMVLMHDVRFNKLSPGIFSIFNGVSFHHVWEGNRMDYKFFFRQNHLHQTF